jgi:hypothetical protein
MDAMKYRTIFSLAALVAGAMVGCSGGVGNGITGPQGCTEIGCGPSFHVEFSRASWPAGKVDIVVDAEGTTTNCTVTLPFASCDNVVQCDQANSAFLIETSGCALPSDQHEIIGVLWPQNGPNEVTVTVSQDGTVLGTKMFQPSYTTSRPNGDGCEPVCNQSQTPASISL